MSELKDCPFCGSGEVELHQQVNSDNAFLHCDTCGASGPSGNNKQMAVDAWNRRTGGTVIIQNYTL